MDERSHAEEVAARALERVLTREGDVQEALSERAQWARFRAKKAGGTLFGEVARRFAAKCEAAARYTGA